MPEVASFLNPKNPHRVQDISAIGIMSAQHTCSVCGKSNIVENWLVGTDGKKVDPVVWTSLKNGTLYRGGKIFNPQGSSNEDGPEAICEICILANILNAHLYKGLILIRSK